MIKAVLWDFSGVITTSHFKEVKGVIHYTITLHTLY